MAGCCNPGNPVGHSSPKPNPCPPGYELRGGRCVPEGKAKESPLYPMGKIETRVKLYPGVKQPFI